jgi:excisionase family DNA binding protein
MSTDKMLTTRDVAERLGYTTSVVSNHAKNGHIPGAVKVWGTWRFDPDALDAWLASSAEAVDTWAKPSRGFAA